jgi:hypothetical protein
VRRCRSRSSRRAGPGSFLISRERVRIPIRELAIAPFRQKRIQMQGIIRNVQARAAIIRCKAEYAGFLRISASLWAYLSTNIGWGKALRLGMWLAGMFVPLGAKTLVQFPDWLAITRMVGWAMVSCVLTPFGMWKHYREQSLKSSSSKI